MLSGAAGGLAILLLDLRFGTRAWSVEISINGILAGLVSITSGCSVVSSWAALLIGVVGGALCFGASHVVLRFQIDDVLGAFSVHGACGMWGLLATALFATEHLSYGRSAGLFYGGCAPHHPLQALLSPLPFSPPPLSPPGGTCSARRRSRCAQSSSGRRYGRCSSSARSAGSASYV